MEFDNEAAEPAAEFAMPRIRQEAGKLKQTNVQICGYEMHSIEVLDRALIAIQNTENSFIDINNRIIGSVNERKSRLNDINNRIANISHKVISLYNTEEGMRVESPHSFPMISTHKSNCMHPHQSIFFERQNILDEDDEELKVKAEIEKFQLPEIYSMKFNRKIFNNRLSNEFENLGPLVNGVTKDINDISKILMGLTKYGNQFNNMKQDIKLQEFLARQQIATAKKINLGQNQRQAQQQSSEGVLGKMPESVESIAELMLWDSNVNVYQESKVHLKEEAFNIRGKKQKTRAQKEQIIHERRNKAQEEYKKIKDQQNKLQAKIIEDKFDVMHRDALGFGVGAQRFDELTYHPEGRDIQQLELKEDIKIGKGNVLDFDEQERKRKERKARKRAEKTRLYEESMAESMMESVQQSMDQTQVETEEDPNDDPERLTMTQADVYDSIKPSMGVAEQRAAAKERAQAQEDLREAQIAKRLADEEEGVDHITNLPLEVLYKAKMEARIAAAMQAQLEGVEDDGRGGAPSLTVQPQLETGGHQAAPSRAASTAQQSKQPAAAKAKASGGGAPAASNLPQAPSVDKYYTFCGGSKPGAPPAPSGGGDLGDLLDAEDAIDFNPSEMNQETFVADLDLDDAPPKPKVAPGEWDPNADMSQMTMAEQLQWQKISNAKKQEAKAAALLLNPPKPRDPEDDWDPNADMSKMTMMQQLQWQKIANNKKQKAKQAAADLAAGIVPEKPAAAGGGGDKKEDGGWDPNADMSKMSMAEQMQWQKIANQKKAEAKAAAAGGGGGGEKKADDGWDPKADMSKMSMAEQMQWQKIANQKKAEAKAAAAAPPGGGAAAADDGWDPNADVGAMSMADQMKWQKIANAKKAEKKAAELAANPPKPVDPMDSWDPNADLSKMDMKQQIQWNMIKMKKKQMDKDAAKKIADDKAELEKSQQEAKDELMVSERKAALSGKKKKMSMADLAQAAALVQSVRQEPARDGTILEMPEGSDDDDDGLKGQARAELPTSKPPVNAMRRSATQMKPKTRDLNVPRKSNMDQLADQIKGRWADINKNLGKDGESSENESSSDDDSD